MNSPPKQKSISNHNFAQDLKQLKSSILSHLCSNSPSQNSSNEKYVNAATSFGLKSQTVIQIADYFENIGLFQKLLECSVKTQNQDLSINFKTLGLLNIKQHEHRGFCTKFGGLVFLLHGLFDFDEVLEYL